MTSPHRRFGATQEIIKRVVKLKDEEGLTFEVLGERFGTSGKTISSLYYRYKAKQKEKSK